MNVPWSLEASVPWEQDTSPSAGNMLSHRAATRSPVPVTAHRRAPAAHAPHAPLQHGRREAAELGEALTGSRLGKMLTQDLHMLSPLSPAPPTAAVNPGVPPSGHALPTGLPLAGFLSFFPTYSYKPSSTTSSFFPFHCTFYQPTSCLHSFHFLETNSFGFPNFQPFYLPMSSASLLSLAPPNPSRHGQQSNIKDKKELETPWC